MTTQGQKENMKPVYDNIIHSTKDKNLYVSPIFNPRHGKGETIPVLHLATCLEGK
jgi:hypothetical protein